MVSKSGAKNLFGSLSLSLSIALVKILKRKVAISLVLVVVEWKITERASLVRSATTVGQEKRRHRTVVIRRRDRHTRDSTTR